LSGGLEDDDDYERGKSGSTQTQTRCFGLTTFELPPSLQPSAAGSHPQPLRGGSLTAASAAPQAPPLCRTAPLTRPLSSGSGSAGRGEFKPARGIGGTFGAPPLAGRLGTSAGYRRHVISDYNRKVRAFNNNGRERERRA
jgi:hypothetical protein